MQGWGAQWSPGRAVALPISTEGPSGPNELPEASVATAASAFATGRVTAALEKGGNARERSGLAHQLLPLYNGQRMASFMRVMKIIL